MLCYKYDHLPNKKTSLLKDKCKTLYTILVRNAKAAKGKQKQSAIPQPSELYDNFLNLSWKEWVSLKKSKDQIHPEVDYLIHQKMFIKLKAFAILAKGGFLRISELNNLHLNDLEFKRDNDCTCPCKHSLKVKIRKSKSDQLKKGFYYYIFKSSDCNKPCQVCDIIEYLKHFKDSEKFDPESY